MNKTNNLQNCLFERSRQSVLYRFCASAILIFILAIKIKRVIGSFMQYLLLHPIGQITEIEVIPGVIALWKPPQSMTSALTGYTTRLYYIDGVERIDIVQQIEDPDNRWLIPVNLPQQRPIFFQVYGMDLYPV